VLQFGLDMSNCSRKMIVGGTDREDRRANPQVAGIIVQDPLQDLGMHQNTVEECSGHGISISVGKNV
jgi:hypothetical protein